MFFRSLTMEDVVVRRYKPIDSSGSQLQSTLDRGFFIAHSR